MKGRALGAAPANKVGAIGSGAAGKVLGGEYDEIMVDEDEVVGGDGRAVAGGSVMATSASKGCTGQARQQSDSAVVRDQGPSSSSSAAVESPPEALTRGSVMATSVSKGCAGQTRQQSDSAVVRDQGPSSSSVAQSPAIPTVVPPGQAPPPLRIPPLRIGPNDLLPIIIQRGFSPLNEDHIRVLASAFPHAWERRRGTLIMPLIEWMNIIFAWNPKIDEQTRTAVRTVTRDIWTSERVVPPLNVEIPRTEKHSEDSAYAQNKKWNAMKKEVENLTETAARAKVESGDGCLFYDQKEELVMEVGLEKRILSVRGIDEVLTKFAEEAEQKGNGLRSGQDMENLLVFGLSVSSCGRLSCPRLRDEEEVAGGGEGTACDRGEICSSALGR